MSPQAVMNSKSSEYSGYNPNHLDGGVREPERSNFIRCEELARLITMKTSSKPSCLIRRDLTYSRAKTDIVARTSKIMMVVANAGPLLRLPPAGGFSREAIVEFFEKVEECKEKLIQAGRFSDSKEVGWGNEREQEAGCI